MDDAFYCREYLCVRDARMREHDFSAWRMVSLLQYQLRGLCSQMRRGEAHILKLFIIRDGVSFEYSESLPGTEMERVISGMAPADELELHLECTASSGDADTEGIMDELDDMAGYEDVSWADIRYECFIAKKPGDDSGRLFRYGMWDGKLYLGEIPQTEPLP